MFTLLKSLPCLSITVFFLRYIIYFFGYVGLSFSMQDL